MSSIPLTVLCGVNSDSWALQRKAEWWLTESDESASECFGYSNNSRMIKQAIEWGQYHDSESEFMSEFGVETEANFLLLIAEAIK